MNVTKYGSYLLMGMLMLLGWSPNSKPVKNSRENNIVFNPLNDQAMKPGAFSISLNVKDLSTSKLFYENLGFTVLAGSMKMNYLIMKNGNALIGLFQGMFEKNMLTFNPGWDENGKNVDPFDDVRTIQQRLKDKGVPLDSEVAANTSGPGSIVLKDPDGNVILFDQHR